MILYSMSWTSMEEVQWLVSLTEAWWEDIGTLRQAIAESFKLNAILHWIQLMVELYVLLCNETGLSLGCSCGRRAPSTIGRKDKEDESPVLQLKDTLLIGNPLLMFISSVACLREC